MDRRERSGGDGMRTRYRQFGVAIVEQTAPKQTSIHMKIFPAEPALNGDLPYAGRTEKRFGFRIFQQMTRSLRKATGTSRRPQQQVRVEKDLQFGALPVAVEKAFNLCLAHPVKVVGNGNAALHKADPAKLPRGRGFKGDNFYERFARLRYHKRLPVHGLFNQSRKVRFGLVNIDRLHRCVPDGLY